MAVEGAFGGWKLGLDLLASRISLVAAKDFKFAPPPATMVPGLARIAPEIAPLGEGITPWPHVFACLRVIGFDDWISVHSEYDHMPVPQLLQQTRQDLHYLRAALAASESITP
jgi:sugar phosphate isomerase/epimerase